MNTKKYRLDYTDEQLIEAINTSRYIKEILEKLHLGTRNEQHSKHVQNRAKELNIDLLATIKNNRRPKIDLTGQMFGQIKVIKFDKYNEYGVAHWLCECSCGITFSIQPHHLLYDSQTSCRSCSLRKPIEPGEKIGKLIVVDRAENDKVYNKSQSLCRCDCGNFIIALNEALRTLNIRSCGCLRKESTSLPYGQAFFNEMLSKYRNAAKVRRLTWELTEEQFRACIMKPCYWCGISYSISKDTTKRIKRYNGIIECNGIDRYDNTKGYTLDNIVPCCTRCNRSKMDQSPEQFITMCIKIARLHADKYETYDPS